ncbi:hypothetical protein ACQCSX_12815 [Pseudarthrobacter sp. P1]|uniref:hypothetical protein n=1 Tax=Pseudarthrobacter sp. P1 TaxID=3418418 RepID=UPI003CEA1D95
MTASTSERTAVGSVLAAVTLAQAQKLAKLALTAPSATEARNRVREQLPILDEPGL